MYFIVLIMKNDDSYISNKNVDRMTNTYLYTSQYSPDFMISSTPVETLRKTFIHISSCETVSTFK